MKFLNVSYNTRNIVVKMMYCTWNIKDFCKYLNISANHYILNHGNGHYILKNEIITMSLRRNNNSSPFICRIYDGSMKIAILTRYSRGIRSEQWLSRRRITVKAYLRRLPVYGPLTERLSNIWTIQIVVLWLNSDSTPFPGSIYLATWRLKPERKRENGS